MPSYQELRDTYPEFLYRGFEIEEDDVKVNIQYTFEIPKLSCFHPSWEFPKNRERGGKWKEDRIFRELVFSLGMVELISYWKITCSPIVRVLAGNLGMEQIAWWKDLYYYGLGEFYYTNQIQADSETFMELLSEGESIKGRISDFSAQNGCLIPLGGGKDSAVTLELLKEEKETNSCYIINPRRATLDTADVGGYLKEQIIASHRLLDPNMLRLNKEGFLNGHTPYSAIVAFSSTIAAYMNRKKYIVLSNESSANESTVEGSYVNHQYSKSFRFEKDFHEYEARFLKSGTYYFSLLRPWSEFQIASYFAQNCEAYHEIFRSCNVGSKENIWCGHCPKCLFVFLILSPFLSEERLSEIFGTDMLRDEKMLPYFKQLIGLTKEKPFECVGSRDEINAAIGIAIDRMKEEKKELPFLFRFYQTTGLYEAHLKKRNYSDYWEEEHLLPAYFLNIMKRGGKRG